MAPTRTAKVRRESQQKHGYKTETKHPKQPGLQKLKSSLRQTKRLLAKDNIAADVRIETERRLKALEADLVQRQFAEKERSLAVRYHKIKFFERQKVLRKIYQAAKLLSSSLPSQRTELEKVLTEARVDLNYILHYPKTKKYISLFPPEVRHGVQKSSTSTPQSTDKERREIRDWIRQQMNSGDLPAKPELHLDSTERRTNDKNINHISKAKRGIPDGSVGMGGHRVASEKNTESLLTKAAIVLESDGFFGEDEDGNSNSSEDASDDDSDETSYKSKSV